MSLLKMSFSATVLIMVIVIVRVLLLHKLPKRTFLVLWGVALCRLLIPFSFPSQFSIYSIAVRLKNSFYKADLPLVGASFTFNSTTIADTVPALSEVTFVSMSPILIIWLIGLSVCALFFLVTHLRCRREYKTALPVDNEFVKRWQQEHLTKRNVQIRQLDKITAPLTYGIFCPVVLLPKKTNWTDDTQLRYILTHEFVHIKRFDTLTKLLLATALCFHWFNPFVWLMYVLANRDIELSCDETVVKTFGESMKSAYALTLIGLEEKKGSLTPLVNNFSKNSIEERIVSIMKMKKISSVSIILAIILVFGIGVVFATSAGTSESPNSTKQLALNEDKVLHYQLPGTPGNHSGYTEKEYETLMTLKTDDYRQLKTQDFLDILQQNNAYMIYTGYNPNDENVDFLKTLQYSLSEYYALLEE
ncbi:M56 family metallopeptidase [Proteiniborus sp. MB09-C3]|uniref:M56 family metallopeptidase n=1 Tax=Proteiniborus sp. MB09-C3 TaxID=3050072 RepID=UPI0025560A89|nr:M56 family metallopeptidase [Proteiniborus sp. MB09-C3]WIV12929.1 M56 family metallopeptidase [Proteiniborus sp. MB09-C3]